MSDPRFKIGDIVWVASYGTTARRVECPHCAGTGRIRVIFADDVEASIDCQNCSSGFNPPSGKVTVWEPHEQVNARYVSGFTISAHGIEWRLDENRICKNEEVFATKEDAEERAKVLVENARKESEDRVLKKEQDTRSWAWNASYHRKEIKRAEASIEYHRRKLAVASLKAKSDRAALEQKS
jgi:hypothetical protein